MSRNSSKQAQAKGGFTLVELVVVIAVLAILAGVGAVAYNGYIEYAKKGVDRKTVGEIMHAVELADYADPSLFGPNGGAMIVLTTDGVKVAGGLEGSDLEGALEDAFGEGSLSNTKLAYSDWDGTPNMSVFKDLKDSAAIKAYDNAGKPASFANNIDDLWNTIQSYTDGSLAQFSGQDYLAKAVESFSGWSETDAGKFQNMWKNGNFTDADGNSLQGRAMAAIAARNYSFYSYAKSQNLESNMLVELDTFKNSLVDFAAGPFDSSSVKNTYFKNNGWSKIMTDYNENQGATDALAFLGMMDAAGEVGKDLDKTVNGYASNDDYKEVMSKYIGMVGNVLSGRVNYEAIAILAEGVTGNAVVINATKKNGVLVWNEESVLPKEANPRTGSGNGASTEEEEVVYTEDGATLNFGSGATSGEIVMKPNTEITITISNLPGGDPMVKDYKTDNDGNVTSASSIQATKTVTINAGAAGSGTVTITWKVETDLVTIPGTLTLNVLIK